ncbi:hypothetical protein [Burkholderia sp. BCC0044]|nr:hypothetical protein [Burkholderia sp. BCC0044]
MGLPRRAWPGLAVRRRPCAQLDEQPPELLELLELHELELHELDEP